MQMHSGNQKRRGFRYSTASPLLIAGDLERWRSASRIPDPRGISCLMEMNRKVSKKLDFESLKERGDNFFVEYSPPGPGMLFATLSVTYIVDVTVDKVINELECQNRKWIERYPVPLMASAFDKLGDLIDLSHVKKTSHLTTLIVNNEIDDRWELLKDEVFPQHVLDSQFLLSTYSDINFRTQSEINLSVDKEAKSMRHFKKLLIFWAVFIPALISILEFISPTWVAIIALAYSLWKAYQHWRLMTGRANKSEKDMAKEEEERKMKHHHYHCELNPDGFLRLKIENFKRSSEENVRNEFNSLPNRN